MNGGVLHFLYVFTNYHQDMCIEVFIRHMSRTASKCSREKNFIGETHNIRLGKFWQKLQMDTRTHFTAFLAVVERLMFERLDNKKLNNKWCA